MNKIQKLIVSMRVVIHLWKKGFYFSENTHKDEKSSMAEYWGFYRLNFDDGKTKEYAILDIDFSEKIAESSYDNKDSYFHVHTMKTIFRMDYYKDGNSICRIPRDSDN